MEVVALQHIGDIVVTRGLSEPTNAFRKRNARGYEDQRQ
jgi:hypothetical protein